MTLPSFFAKRITPDPATDCWLWTAGKDKDGYARTTLNGAAGTVHRILYEILVGPIPDGLQLDHVAARGCTSTSCVNPAHLEPVTPRENSHRSTGKAAVNARKTRCDYGHTYTPENTYRRPDGSRECRTCRRLARQRKL